MTTTALVAALSLGLPAFPCGANKSPAIPGPGGHKHATADPVALRVLWQRHPGPLVGVPTGEASEIDVFDIDAPRHPEAAEWLAQHRNRLPPTRAHRTRSGGSHLLFLHAAGLGCSASRIAPGLDVRASGGYVVWWPAAGLPVLCDAPLALWPQWLLDELTRSRDAVPSAPWTPPLDPSQYRTSLRYAGAALRNAAERIARAPIGSRNSTLNAEAYCVGRFIAAGLLDPQHVADTLASAAIAAGLPPRETEATLRSALGARGLL
jgi:hypothetical protein